MTLFQTSRLQVRLIEGHQDLSQVVALRSLCFERPFEANEFDRRAHHLLVEVIETQAVVGAYRLTASSAVPCLDPTFESQEDFELSGWLEKPGKKVELAWACTHPEYRQGVVIALLWKGLAHYLKTEKVRYLFGPASLSGKSQSDVMETLRYLKENDFDLKESGIEARWQVPWPKTGLGATSHPGPASSKRRLPALLRAYLMAGAFVLLQPVFDPDTNCFDFMTVLELDHCNESLRQHFDL